MPHALSTLPYPLSIAKRLGGFALQALERLQSRFRARFLPQRDKRIDDKYKQNYQRLYVRANAFLLRVFTEERQQE